MVASLSFRGPHLERRRDDKLPTSRKVALYKDPENRILLWNSEKGVFSSLKQNIISTFSVTLEIQFPVFVEVYAISQQAPGYILQYQTQLWFGSVHPSSDVCLTITPLSEEIFHWWVEPVFRATHFIKTGLQSMLHNHTYTITRSRDADFLDA